MSFSRKKYLRLAGPLLLLIGMSAVILLAKKTPPAGIRCQSCAVPVFNETSSNKDDSELLEKLRDIEQKGRNSGIDGSGATESAVEPPDMR